MERIAVEALRDEERETRVCPELDSMSPRCRSDADRPSVGGMTTTPTSIPTALDVATLLREIRRYLAAVDEFRRLGCEPRWRPEEARS